MKAFAPSIAMTLAYVGQGTCSLLDVNGFGPVPPGLKCIKLLYLSI